MAIGWISESKDFCHQHLIQSSEIRDSGRKQ
jgi:hypothetical protein